MATLEFYMATNNGSGAALQINADGNSDVFFELAKQTPGTTQQTKSFDWKNKSFFGLNEFEINKVLQWGKWVITQQSENEIKFPHLNSSQPKNIVFKYSAYNGKYQVSISSIPANQNNQNTQNNQTPKSYNCSIENFNLILTALEGNLKNKLVSNGLFQSVVLDESYQVLKKKIFIPKMNIGEKIYSEKKDPNNHTLVVREFLQIIDISYNMTNKEFIYIVRK